jgi:hypothetical protein
MAGGLAGWKAGRKVAYWAAAKVARKALRLVGKKVDEMEIHWVGH